VSGPASTPAEAPALDDVTPFDPVVPEALPVDAPLIAVDPPLVIFEPEPPLVALALDAAVLPVDVEAEEVAAASCEPWPPPGQATTQQLNTTRHGNSGLRGSFIFIAAAGC